MSSMKKLYIVIDPLEGFDTQVSQAHAMELLKKVPGFRIANSHIGYGGSKQRRNYEDERRFEEFRHEDDAFKPTPPQPTEGDLINTLIQVRDDLNEVLKLKAGVAP